MLGALVLGGLGAALVSNPRRKRRRNPFLWHGAYRFPPTFKNPRLSAALRKRLMEWRSPLFPAIKALATSRYPATEAHDALRALQAQYERPDLRRKSDLDHLAKTIRMVEQETGVSASNPRRRARKVSPSGAAARLAHWRWHHNPSGFKSFAERLLEWHGGQGSATYLVGSRLYAGKPVERKDYAAAAAELKAVLMAGKFDSAADRESLVRLYDRLILMNRL